MLQCALDFFLQKLAESNQLVTLAEVKTAMDLLRGAVMIVYPMGLPPHDPIKMEFDDEEDLEGTQVAVVHHVGVAVDKADAVVVVDDVADDVVVVVVDILPDILPLL